MGDIVEASGVEEPRYFCFELNKLGFILFFRLVELVVARLSTTRLSDYKFWKVPLDQKVSSLISENIPFYNERLRLRLGQQHGWRVIEKTKGAARHPS